jgi:pimeloyl-ACP methyl ester carboxylesterase
LAGRISAGQYPVFVQKMPLDLAVFGIRSAEKIMDDHPGIEKWVIVGHSLGGAMAARFALENENQVQGLVFLAAYPDVDLSTSGLAVLSLLGNRDQVINLPRFTQSQSLLPADADIRTISGGNHAGFAHYGPQCGDGAAYINRDQQQNIAADAIRVLLETLENESEPQ